MRQWNAAPTRNRGPCSCVRCKSDRCCCKRGSAEAPAVVHAPFVEEMTQFRLPAARFARGFARTASSKSMRAQGMPGASLAPTAQCAKMSPRLALLVERSIRVHRSPPHVRDDADVPHVEAGWRQYQSPKIGRKLLASHENRAKKLKLLGKSVFSRDPSALARCPQHIFFVKDRCCAAVA